MDIVLPEIVSAGIYNAQLAAKGRGITKNRKTVMFEIELPLEDGGVSTINSEDMPIRTDTIICAKPGQMRHTRLPFACYYIHLIVNEGGLCETLMDMPNFIKIESIDRYRALFERFCRHYGSGVSSEEMILHSIILEIIYKLSLDGKKISVREKVKSSNYAVIKKVINYIKENPTADLSLGTVASMAGFSEVYFHNCFKASTGETLHAYVETQRIKRAANMLISTDKTLTEIAYECGFSSQSYFSYAFKRKLGVTPREYANKVFEQYEESFSDE